MSAPIRTRRLPDCPCDGCQQARVERFMAGLEQAGRQIWVGLLLSGAVVAICEAVRHLSPATGFGL